MGRPSPFCNLSRRRGKLPCKAGRLLDSSEATRSALHRLEERADKREVEAVRVDRLGPLACTRVDEFAGELPCVPCRRPSGLTVSKILSRLVTIVVRAPLFHVRPGLELSPLWPRDVGRNSGCH